MPARFVVASSLLTLLSVIVPATADAQERGHFAVGFGGGYGTGQLTCDDCDSGRESGGAGYFWLAGALNDQNLLGVEVDLWTKTSFGATLNVVNVSGTYTLYPSPTSDFYVKLGMGVSSFDVVEIVFQGQSFDIDFGSGFGAVFGAGYDVRVSNRVSVTPAVNVWLGFFGDIEILGLTLAERTNGNVIAFTVGLTIR
jgi:hypothetical protein